MSDKKWLVIKCPGCKLCFGHRTLSGRCPHCGQRVTDAAEVLTEVFSSTELRLEVALANTPENLRDTLRAKLSENELLFDPPQSPSPNILIDLIRRKCDEKNSVSRVTVAAVLMAKNADMDADGLMERAEQEGLVLRIGEGRWQFLE
ncbi:MAG TPA: hypothetical protein QGI72_02035 [Poseidonia sp.]|nr:hypothetical protein [Poseidonia sp.]